MVRVKICGITRPEDAVAAADAGADAIGLLFYAKSRRCVSRERAAAILAELPPFVTPVALFVNEAVETIKSICDELGVRTVQLHGDEPPAVARELAPLTVIKAFRVGSPADPEAMAGYPASAYLLDTRVEGSYGGTGESFDWALAARARRYGRIIVAGGLTPENVAEAVRVARPFGVDASSGVESAPGVKDKAKVAAFVAAARGA